MNEMEICFPENEIVAQNTVLDKHFASNTYGYCDLFETQLFKESWCSLQENENTLFDATLEQLVNSLRP
ncbi:MAG: hypothetical protein GQF41_2657 [Candidatus Rifleibacterium amylolyticum]|nr:MAG: hypothetical protein GQF41_2657 [Candidatus Rifleibacterium amylolyticum]NLF97048.1 hypothetical protein [Candidatus Riflebacteria bacterium]